MDRLVTLPPLREDLALIEAAANHDGSPAWMIHDPVVNRFYRIGLIEFELLSRWSAPSAARLLAATAAETRLDISAAELDALVDFLRQHNLLRTSDPAAVSALVARADEARGRWWRRLLHDYLFFRVPLLRPQRWLERWLPRVRFLATPGFAIGVALCSLVGLWLAARQWDVFLASVEASLTPAGLVGYAVALSLAKSLHELGHAFTATHYRVRVAHMGVAFLVLWPMLYTDTGESWKLSDRRQRFAIAAAGIAVELALAGLATLGWSLAQDGALRDALFFLATTSWLLTVAINASPFMRFDGYFLLSDALDLPNLHQRAFAHARAALRRAVLGIDAPETAGGPRRALIAFAWLTWSYRLVVFVGIALAVYHFFFKALGLILFAVEIGWFVVRPVAAELSAWARSRRQAEAGHVARSLLIVVAVLALLVVPWNGAVRGTGWLHAERQQLLHAPYAARLVEPVVAGDRSAGEPLVVMASPDTAQRIEQASVAVASLERQLALSVGTADGRERRPRIAERLASEVASLAAQRAEQDRLVLRAPFAGRLADIDETLRPGTWVAPDQPIAVLFDPGRWVVDGYVDQTDVARVRPGARARFHRRGSDGPAIAGVVDLVDASRQPSFGHPMLAVDHGGELAAVRAPDGNLVPRAALYRVRIRIDPSAGAAVAVRGVRQAPGTIVIDAEPRSLLLDAARTALSVLIRESGF